MRRSQAVSVSSENFDGRPDRGPFRIFARQPEGAGPPVQGLHGGDEEGVGDADDGLDAVGEAVFEQRRAENGVIR